MVFPDYQDDSQDPDPDGCKEMDPHSRDQGNRAPDLNGTSHSEVI